MCPEGNRDSGVESKYCVIKILSPQFRMLQVSCSLSSRISRTTGPENVLLTFFVSRLMLQNICNDAGEKMPPDFPQHS